MRILNVMLIFTVLASSGYARPFIAPSPIITTNIQNMNVADDIINNSELSFEFPFPDQDHPLIQSPIPDFPLPKIPGFPFPRLPPFNIPGIPNIPFPTPPPVSV
ncbi:hypothetical protein LXL04_011814 [Taraxacum kok-saghyz]